MNNLVNSVHHTNNPINGMSEYSTASGSNVIIFEITGNQNELLNLNSIRLCAKVGIRNSAGQNVQNFGWISGETGGVGAGTNGLSVDTLQFSNIDTNARVGLSSVIQSITLMDGNNNTLESVYQYGSLLHKVSQLSMSADDMGTWGGCYYGISSYGKALVNQKSLNSDRDLSMKLYTGVLQSKPIPFSLIGNKLKIQILLAPSSQIFFTSDLARDEVGKSADGAKTRGLNARALLRDIKLTYRTIVLPDKAPMLKQYNFRHFTTLQNTISSSNNTTQYHPTATNAISVMSSFIPSEYLNNFSFDSFLTGRLSNGQTLTGGKDEAKVNEIRFLKNSTQFPLQFPVNERVVIRNQSFPSQQLYYYLSTIEQMDRLDNCIVNPTTEVYGSVQEFSNPDYNVPVYGVGIRYDSLNYGQGTNFTNSNYLLRLDSQLDGSENNEVLTQVLSTRKIVMGAGQPVVMV